MSNRPRSRSSEETGSSEDESNDNEAGVEIRGVKRERDYNEAEEHYRSVRPRVQEAPRDTDKIEQWVTALQTLVKGKKTMERAVSGLK